MMDPQAVCGGTGGVLLLSSGVGPFARERSCDVDESIITTPRADNTAKELQTHEGSSSLIAV